MIGKIQIFIPAPCHENWQNMTVADKGRFCTSCQKNVVDFTSLPDREIINILEKQNQVCGRFRYSQLNRDLIQHKEKSTLWIAAGTGVLAFLGLGTTITQAQEKQQVVLPVKTSEAVIVPDSKEEISVSGNVVDENDTLLPGVSIVIKGTTKGISTDFDGNFNLAANEGDVLVFSYVGYKSETNVVEKSNLMKVRMTPGDITLGAVIFVKKRTFFGRIFRSIGRIFK